VQPGLRHWMLGILAAVSTLVNLCSAKSIYCCKPVVSNMWAVCWVWRNIWNPWWLTWD